MSVFQFDLNDFRCAVLLDGKLPVNFDEFFPSSGDYFSSEDHPEFAKSIMINILLVDTGSQRVLIDTGLGRDVGNGEGKLVEQLAEVDVTPDMIDAIIFTHGHWDHIGGIIDASGELIFRNADYYMSKSEWELFTSDDSLAEMPDVLRQWAEECLPPIADQVKLFQPDDEMITGFLALNAPGHTPGQVAIQITSGNRSLISTADVALHTMQIHYPEIGAAVDMDPDTATATRYRLWEQIANNEWLVHGFHFTFPGLGIIKQVETGYQWEPWSKDICG